MSLLRHLCLALAFLAINGCDGRDAATSRPPTSTAPAVVPPSATEQAATARRQIARWLECEECVSGELDAVKALGKLAVPTLAATLRDGPSPATREKLRLSLEDTYPRLRAYADKPPGTSLRIARTDYVDVHLDNQKARYRARSARALAAIGGDEARKALTDAIARGHLPPEVQQELLEALNQIPVP